MSSLKMAGSWVGATRACRGSTVGQSRMVAHGLARNCRFGRRSRRRTGRPPLRPANGCGFETNSEGLLPLTGQNRFDEGQDRLLVGFGSSVPIHS